MAIPDHDSIRACLQREYGLTASSLTSVAGGNDEDAAVYRANTATAAYVVKVRQDSQLGGLVAADQLADAGVSGVVGPLRTSNGRLRTLVDGCQLSVLPWVEGRSALETGLTEGQLRSFGALLAQIHRDGPREAIDVPQELYCEPALAIVEGLHSRSAANAGDEDMDGMAQRWHSASERIDYLLHQVAEREGQLRASPPDAVLCHGDAHLANLLVDAAGALWLIDWDEASVAPKERDLMFVLPGVLLPDKPVTDEQRQWFFDGYGEAGFDPASGRVLPRHLGVTGTRELRRRRSRYRPDCRRARSSLGGSAADPVAGCGSGRSGGVFLLDVIRPAHDFLGAHRPGVRPREEGPPTRW